MKNKFRNLFLLLILAVSMPITMFLTACGATPSGTVKGIKFDTMIYDEETGYAVFEVDKDVTTDLTYKIFPSSGSGYKIYFDPIDKGTAENSSRFTFKDGRITVHSSNFEDVRYRVRVSDYSDTCIIKLKEYPVSISSTETTQPVETVVNLNSFETHAINVVARYISDLGVTSYKNITEDDYDFLVETSDETVVNVPNPNRLKFCAVRNGSASATVTVTILDKKGEKTNLTYSITVNIIQNISRAFVIASGNNLFIEDNSSLAEEDKPEIEINFASLAEESGLKTIKFKIYMINSVNVLMDGDCSYSIQLSSKKYASVSSDGKYILLNSSVENGYILKVKLCTDLTMKDGSLFSIDMKLKIVK